MDIGERIKALRKSLGLTQSELGELLGVKKAAVQKYENGLIVNLKIDTITKLSDIFKVSPAYLINGNKFDDKYNVNKIKKEVRIAEVLSEVFEDRERDLVYKCLQLNRDGLKQLKSYVDDLIEIKKYQR